MLAHFHSSGTCPVSSKVLKIFAWGVDIVFLFLIISVSVGDSDQEIVILSAGMISST